jgi:nitrite reductase (cytochrome c-552)
MATETNPTDSSQTARRFRTRTLIFATLAAAVASAGVAGLLITIFEHKQEEKTPHFRVVELTDETTDPAVWGKNFPFQYDSYLRTVDQKRTRYGGSEAVPHTPTQADPRSVVAQSRLEEDPRLKTMWAAAQQPGTCLHCHASVYVPYKKAGNGDLIKGFEKVNQMKYQEAVKLVDHPVSCIDCHAPDTMQLRVTRPGFLEGIKKLKATQGFADYEVNRDASRQEMRTFVCGQCHVEYYFKGPEKRLTYPWAKGIRVDDIYDYYQEEGFKDWVHADTGAKVLKAQHPEFETFNQGTHAKAGVSCADCHMPYQRVGAAKVSDHHVRSPLLNINNACQTCHKVPESELRERAETVQGRTYRMRDQALDALVSLIADLKVAKAAGKSDEELAPARELQRRAQFYLDFVEAENSIGFHAPQESVRVLGESINYARQGQIALRDPSFKVDVPARASAGLPPPPVAPEGAKPAH